MYSLNTTVFQEALAWLLALSGSTAADGGSEIKSSEEGMSNDPK